MNFIRIFTVFVCFGAVKSYGHETNEEYHDDHNQDDNNSSKSSYPSEPIIYFPNQPERIKIVKVDPTPIIKYDNKGEMMMGVSDEHCDNGRVNSKKLRLALKP